MGGYQIIKFTEENTVEVVPSAWLINEEGQQMCMWPNTPSQSLISMAIKSQQIPKEDWKKFLVKILSKHPYESFTLATAKATKATYTSCLESESDALTADVHIKRQKKKNKRFVSSSSEEGYSSPRRSPRFKIQNACPRSLKYPTPPKVQKTTNLSTNPQAQLAMGKTISAVRNLEETLTINATSKCASCIKHEESFTRVIRLLHIINGRVAQNIDLITTLLNQAQENAAPEPENELDVKLPVTSYEALMNLDKKLEDSTMKKLLINKLLHVGGDTIKEVIKRIFPKLIDDVVLKQFSLLGGKGKKIFSCLNLSTLIKDVCKQNKNTKQFTEKEVEQVVAIFLTKATERCNRKRNKENKETTSPTE